MDLYGQVYNAFDAGKSITRASDPNPLPLAQVLDVLALKALHTGPYQSEVHR